MATRRLDQLIKASGNAGTSGQGFLTHVTGAASGVGCKTSDYYITGWTWGFEPDYPLTTYTSGHQFNMEFDIDGASRASNILNTLAAINKVDVDVPFGAAVTVDSSSILGMTGNTVSVTITAPIVTTAAIGGEGNFANSPQSEFDREEIIISATISGGAADGSTDDVSWQLTFNPNKNSSLWNDTLGRTQTAKMAKRSATLADYDFEWYSNSDYTGLVDSTDDFLVSPGTFPGESLTYYLKSRIKGSGTWVEEGAVTWTDPRDAG